MLGSGQTLTSQINTEEEITKAKLEEAERIVQMESAAREKALAEKASADGKSQPAQAQPTTKPTTKPTAGSQDYNPLNEEFNLEHEKTILITRPNRITLVDEKIENQDEDKFKVNYTTRLKDVKTDFNSKKGLINTKISQHKSGVGNKQGRVDENNKLGQMEHYYEDFTNKLIKLYKDLGGTQHNWYDRFVSGGGKKTYKKKKTKRLSRKNKRKTKRISRKKTRSKKKTRKTRKKRSNRKTRNLRSSKIKKLRKKRR